MAALGAADVTYTVVKQKKLEDGRKIVQVTIAFGDGSKTYPTGGVPLTIGKMACPVVVDSFVLDDAGASAYKASFVKSSGKLMLSGVAQHAHDLILKNAAVADGATTRVNVGTNLLGGNTGADLTVAGAGANGGVQNSASGTNAAYMELASTVAPVAQTFKVTVIGY